MKDFLSSVYSYLSNNAELKKIVGKNIYPMFIPQYEKVPAVVYYPVSVVYDSTLKKDSGYIVQTIQFDCHDTSFKKTRALSRIIRKMFQDYCGDMYGVFVQATFIKSDLILNDSNSNKFDATDVIHVIEVEFQYQEK